MAKTNKHKQIKAQVTVSLDRERFEHVAWLAEVKGLTVVETICLLIDEAPYLVIEQPKTPWTSAPRATTA